MPAFEHVTAGRNYFLLMAKNFDISTAKGLSDAEAAKLLKDVGYNELPSAKPRTILAIAWEVVKEPMFLLLVAGGLVYLLLGDLQEALMLLGFVLVVMGITFYQERKTERALESLRDLSSPRALVIRDGVEKRIAGRDVVPGDLIVLAEGDRVPADAVLLSCTNLSADESLLTGESVSVRKVCSESPEKSTCDGSTRWRRSAFRLLRKPGGAGPGSGSGQGHGN